MAPKDSEEVVQDSGAEAEAAVATVVVVAKEEAVSGEVAPADTHTAVATGVVMLGVGPEGVTRSFHNLSHLSSTATGGRRPQ